MIDVTSTRDIDACQSLRRTVFIDEQGVSLAEEQDGRDDDALHLLACIDGQPVGTARILIDGSVGKIGRVCVLPAHRGKGIGAALTNAAVDLMRGRADIKQARLGAQLHALAFYERLGFTAEGPEFDDAGIRHREMVQTL